MLSTLFQTGFGSSTLWAVLSTKNIISKEEHFLAAKLLKKRRAQKNQYTCVKDLGSDRFFILNL